ncbi:hypothetical protein LEMLEM_LOCUS5547, partial [Lemmus lemmus]
MSVYRVPGSSLMGLPEKYNSEIPKPTQAPPILSPGSCIPPRVTWAECCQGPEDHRNQAKPKPPTECHRQIRPHRSQDPIR